jgi:4-aminobutyrate aminotransferase-like enzyme
VFVCVCVDGSSLGPLATASFVHKNHKFGHSSTTITQVDGPLVSQFGAALSKSESASIRSEEVKCLKKVEAALSKHFDVECDISGAYLLIEPIIGSEGVWTYRPSFLLQLRQLCDKYKVSRT